MLHIVPDAGMAPYRTIYSALARLKGTMRGAFETDKVCSLDIRSKAEDLGAHSSAADHYGCFLSAICGAMSTWAISRGVPSMPWAVGAPE